MFCEFAYLSYGSFPLLRFSFHFTHAVLVIYFPAKRLCSCGRNHGQRKTSPISWQPSLFRARGGLDPRKTAGRDYDEAGKMQIGKETANRRSLRQASQHCGVFLQVALPVGFHLSQYCLLDLFRWNCGLRTSRFHLARLSQFHCPSYYAYSTLRLQNSQNILLVSYHQPMSWCVQLLYVHATANFQTELYLKSHKGLSGHSKGSQQLLNFIRNSKIQ